ncbi:MAG: ABC transporter permease [Vulcanimicrobiaceae bacterium]
MNYAMSHPDRMMLLFSEHLVLVASALVLAGLLAVPLAVLSLRNARAASVILGSLTVLYTIPSLALFAVLVRLLGLGFLPAVIALAAYAQIFLARAIVAAYADIPIDLRESAVAMGMSQRQRFTRIELPLALPKLLAGLRVAAIASIGLGALAGYVSAGGMGELIFSGLALHNMQMTIAGALPVALLAIVTDLAMRQGERLASLRAHQ